MMTMLTMITKRVNIHNDMQLDSKILFKVIKYRWYKLCN